jgi:short-subunit dehydrogenase
MSRRVALITGGSSGVGRAVAQLLVARGYWTVLVARSASMLSSAVAELGPEHSSGVVLDVGARDALLELPERVVKTHGRLDVLVNNAGVNHRGPLNERSAQEIAQIVDVDLLAPMLLTRAALPYLQRGASIVNVASLAGKLPVPHEASYCAAKAGLRAFSRALGWELRDHGIRVSTVCPGPIDTGFIADAEHVPDLVFSQPMRSAQQVAETVMRALDTGAPELDVPALSGRLATLGYLLPGLMELTRPLLERRGAANKRRYLRRTARSAR